MSTDETHESSDVGEPAAPAATRHRKRGLKRRREILEATLRIVAREGTSGATHRTVAAEAKVPLSATTYYFESKEDLLTEAFRLHAERDARRVAHLAKRMGDESSRDQLAGWLADFLYYDLHQGRQGMIAQYELLLHSARHPELEASSRAFYGEIEAILERALERLCSPTPAVDAQLILAAVAGIEVDSLSMPSRRLGRAGLRVLTSRLVDALFVSTPSA